MFGRLLKEESGIALPLAIFTVVIVAVMGAGLLTFASTELNNVAEVNQGQKAFEMADAGVQAAKRQLISAPDPKFYDNLAIPIADNPWADGSGGMDLTMDDDGVNVRIQSNPSSLGSFTVTSTGCSPADCSDARRRVEATYRYTNSLNAPPAYFSRTNITYNGTASARGISLFSLGNVDKPSVAGGIGSEEDAYFKKWAETADSYSYPNLYNKTARSSELSGVGALGTVSSRFSDRESRVFDKDTTVKMVPDWEASERPANQKISFPFDTSRERLDQDIETLRKRAQQLEAQDPSYDYYRTSISGGEPLDSWPSNSDYDTVVFYEFSSYSSSNLVTLGLTGGSCANPSSKGVIVVVNGDYFMTGTTKFGGGVITYTNTDNIDRGTFTSRGSGCLTGYANTTGKIDSSGTPDIGSAPALSTLPALADGMQLMSWRELYQ